MSLHEVEEAASIVQHAADPEANIIVGQVINPDMGDELIVTVIATGFEREEDAASATIGAERANELGRPNRSHQCWPAWVRHRRSIDP